MTSQQISKILEKLILGLTLAIVGVLPLFFLPLVSDFYDLPKNTLLILVSLALLTAWAGKMAAEGKVAFRKTLFDLPVLLIPLTYIVSTLLVSANKLETLYLPASTGTMIALAILYFLITNNLAGKGRYLMTALIFSGVILTLLSLYQFAGLSRAISLAPYLKEKSWTPIGNQLNLAVLLATVLVLSVTKIYQEWKSTKITFAVGLWGGVTAVIALGLALSVYQLTTAKPVLLPHSVSWAIAVDSFKDFRRLLLGVGPASYLEAFSRFRPLFYNLSDFWSVRFLSSSSYLLQVVTTVGLFGLAAWPILLWQLRRLEKAVQEKEKLLPLGLAFLALIFLPGTVSTLFLFFILLAATVSLEPETPSHSEQSKILPLVILSIVTVVSLSSGIFMIRVIVADSFFQKSLESLARGEGTPTYDNQIRAINANPYNPAYRLAYSQTNLALASSLAGRPPAGGLSDQDRATISQLVQQAIREAKAAVALNPRSIIAWENLANIYRQLINFAGGADQWALASLQQAIALDPFNPNLRISLGGLLYSQANYDEAIRFFQQAVDLKPDLANAHYNLAAAYKEKRDFAKAASEMEIALSLVSAGTPDFDRAKKELDDLKSKLPAATPSSQLRATEAGELIAPSLLPSPAIKPPLELLEGAEPPATNEVPTD